MKPAVPGALAPLRADNPIARALELDAALNTRPRRTIRAVRLPASRIDDPLREWVGTSVISWSPTNGRVQGLWTALTGDTISEAPDWAAYKEGTKQRHAFVHRAAAVSEEQAETFIRAAEQIVGHVVDVMTEVFPSDAA
jgi:hypothetical protein